MNLYEHQNNSVEDIRWGLQRRIKQQLLMLATGGGKTAIAGYITQLASHKRKRVWFMVDNLDLVNQTVETFRKFGLDPGVIQGDHPDTNYSKDIQVVMAQTLCRRWWVFDHQPDLLPDLCFIDEAHVQHKAHRQFINGYPHIPVIGLSATPFSKGLGNYYKRLIQGATTTELIEDGKLIDFDVYGPDVPDMKGCPVNNKGEWSEDHAAKRVVKLIGSVVTNWLQKASDRITIAFCSNIAHSKSMALEFQSAGVNAVHLDGYMKEEREDIVSRFKGGKIQILCCVSVAEKGFDAPICDCLILAAPVKSLMRHIQQCGRLLRIFDGKKTGVIYDHAGNMERLGFPTDTLPTVLCTKLKGDKSKTEVVERKEPLPTRCKICHHLSIDIKCPKCGHETEKKHNVVELKGKLKKLVKSKHSMAEKEQWFSMFLYYSRGKGFSDGWASHKYREKFGVWPSKKSVITAIPNVEVMKFITHLNIKRSKRG